MVGILSFVLFVAGVAVAADSGLRRFVDWRRRVIRNEIAAYAVASRERRESIEFAVERYQRRFRCPAEHSFDVDCPDCVCEELSTLPPL